MRPGFAPGMPAMSWATGTASIAKWAALASCLGSQQQAVGQETSYAPGVASRWDYPSQLASEDCGVVVVPAVSDDFGLASPGLMLVAVPCSWPMMIARVPAVA